MIEDDTGLPRLDTQTDLSGQKVCLVHIRDALREIEDWVGSIRRTLECFDLDDCACCSGTSAAEVDLEKLARETLGADTPAQRSDGVTKISPGKGDA